MYYKYGIFQKKYTVFFVYAVKTESKEDKQKGLKPLAFKKLLAQSLFLSKFDSLFQLPQFCSICDNDQRSFLIKHLLGIDIHVDLIALLNSNDIKAVFFAKI